MNFKTLNLKQITRIALLAAVIIVAQQLKFQYFTGPLVNAAFVIGVFTTGIPGAVLLSFLSPVLALAQGIMPNAALLPFIALGNLVYCVLFYRFQNNLLLGFMLAPPIKAFIIAAGGYLVVGLPLPGAYAMGLTQLITALAGLIIGVVLWKYIKHLGFF